MIRNSTPFLRYVFVEHIKIPKYCFIKEQQKQVNWQVDPLDDSDKSSSYASSMKALGENNPESLRYRKAKSNTEANVQGGKKNIYTI